MGASEELQGVVLEDKPFIRYELEVEDYVRFNLFHFHKTKLGRNEVMKYRMKVIALAALILYLIGCLAANSFFWFPFLLLAFGTTVMWLKTLIFYRSTMRSEMKKEFKKSEHKLHLCEYILSIEETGFVLKTNHSESKIAWAAMEKIETEPDYTYLYIGTKNAVIIPNKSISEGNIATVLNAIKTHYKPGQMLNPAQQSPLM